jgi:hypothetical protein
MGSYLSASFSVHCPYAVEVLDENVRKGLLYHRQHICQDIPAYVYKNSFQEKGVCRRTCDGAIGNLKES